MPLPGGGVMSAVPEWEVPMGVRVLAVREVSAFLDAQGFAPRATLSDARGWSVQPPAPEGGAEPAYLCEMGLFVDEEEARRLGEKWKAQDRRHRERGHRPLGVEGSTLTVRFVARPDPTGGSEIQGGSG